MYTFSRATKLLTSEREWEREKDRTRGVNSYDIKSNFHHADGRVEWKTQASATFACFDGASTCVGKSARSYALMHTGQRGTLNSHELSAIAYKRHSRFSPTHARVHIVTQNHSENPKKPPKEVDFGTSVSRTRSPQTLWKRHVGSFLSFRCRYLLVLRLDSIVYQSQRNRNDSSRARVLTFVCSRRPRRVVVHRVRVIFVYHHRRRQRAPTSPSSFQ